MRRFMRRFETWSARVSSSSSQPETTRTRVRTCVARQPYRTDASVARKDSRARVPYATRHVHVKKQTRAESQGREDHGGRKPTDRHTADVQAAERSFRPAFRREWMLGCVERLWMLCLLLLPLLPVRRMTRKDTTRNEGRG